MVSHRGRRKHRGVIPLPLQRAHRRGGGERQARESVQQPLGFPTRPREDSGVPHQEPLCDKQQGGVQQEEIHPRRPRGGEELPRSGEHLFRQDFAHVLVSQTRRGEGHGVHMGGYVRRDGGRAMPQFHTRISQSPRAVGERDGGQKGARLCASWARRKRTQGRSPSMP